MRMKVMRPDVVNLRSDNGSDVVRVDRSTKFGNPFRTGRDGTRDEVIAKYRLYLWSMIKSGKITMQELAALDGKPLGCWCAPKACHAEVLVKASAWAAREVYDLNRHVYRTCGCRPHEVCPICDGGEDPDPPSGGSNGHWSDNLSVEAKEMVQDAVDYFPEDEPSAYRQSLEYGKRLGNCQGHVDWPSEEFDQVHEPAPTIRDAIDQLYEVFADAVFRGLPTEQIDYQLQFLRQAYNPGMGKRSTTCYKCGADIEHSDCYEDELCVICDDTPASGRILQHKAPCPRKIRTAPYNDGMFNHKAMVLAYLHCIWEWEIPGQISNPLLAAYWNKFRCWKPGDPADPVTDRVLSFSRHYAAANEEIARWNAKVYATRKTHTAVYTDNVVLRDTTTQAHQPVWVKHPEDFRGN